MAEGLDTGVPWIMCKETDAPDPVVGSTKPMNLLINFQFFI